LKVILLSDKSLILSPELVKFLLALLEQSLRILDTDNGQQLGVQLPPLPLPKRERNANILLNAANGRVLDSPLLRRFLAQKAAAVGLQLDDQTVQFFIPLVLQPTQHSGPEENLGYAEFELTGVNLQIGKQCQTRIFVVIFGQKSHRINLVAIGHGSMRLTHKKTVFSHKLCAFF
jgi:hypothetical protein